MVYLVDKLLVQSFFSAEVRGTLGDEYGYCSPFGMWHGVVW
jgi:hypothetical protein